jgi:hypothetical protein
MKRRATLLVLLAGLGVAGAVTGATMSRQDQWQEIAWPFPRDAWPSGRAFAGHGVQVYIRPKLGFCNCATGVSGDAEVDAVTDLDMMADDFTPNQPGEWVKIAGMAGRTRSYTLKKSDGTQIQATGTAISRRCDVVVAASQGPKAATTKAQRAIADLIATPRIIDWLNTLLGKG